MVTDYTIGLSYEFIVYVPGSDAGFIGSVSNTFTKLQPLYLYKTVYVSYYSFLVFHLSSYTIYSVLTAKFTPKNNYKCLLTDVQTLTITESELC